MFQNAFLLGLILPLGVAACVLGLATFYERARPGSGVWGGAVALAAGYIAGHWGLRGWPPIPGRARLERPDWLFYLALAAAALAVWMTRRPRPAWSVYVLRAVLCLAAVTVLLLPLLDRWAPWERVAWIGGLTASAWFWWLSMEALARRASSAGWLMPLGVVAGVSSVVTLLSGTAAVAQSQGVLLAALLPALVLACWGRARDILRSSLGVLAVLLPCTWIIGLHYADVPAYCVALLWLAPQAAWIGQLPVMKRRPIWQATTMATLLTAEIAGTALGITVWNFVKEEPGVYDYGSHLQNERYPHINNEALSASRKQSEPRGLKGSVFSAG